MSKIGQLYTSLIRSQVSSRSKRRKNPELTRPDVVHALARRDREVVQATAGLFCNSSAILVLVRNRLTNLAHGCRYANASVPTRDLIIAGCAGEVNRFLIRNPAAARRMRWATGALLIGVGARLAFAERN